MSHFKKVFKRIIKYEVGLDQAVQLINLSTPDSFRRGGIEQAIHTAFTQGIGGLQFSMRNAANIVQIGALTYLIPISLAQGDYKKAVYVMTATALLEAAKYIGHKAMEWDLNKLINYESVPS